jgi:hypothetical protein
MADLKKLEQFTFEETEEGYAFHISAEGGQELSVEVTPEQLDAIIDALDEMLSADDEALAADDGDEAFDEGEDEIRDGGAV